MHMRAVEHTINRGSCTHHAAWVNHTENRCKSNQWIAEATVTKSTESASMSESSASETRYSILGWRGGLADHLCAFVSGYDPTEVPRQVRRRLAVARRAIPRHVA